MEVDRAGRGELTVHHVDVFTDRALAGNGLTVVSSPTPLEPDTMLRIAQELRQFETIFLFDVVDGGSRGAHLHARGGARLRRPPGARGGRRPARRVGTAGLRAAGVESPGRRPAAGRHDGGARRRSRLGRDGPGTRRGAGDAVTGRRHPTRGGRRRGAGAAASRPAHPGRQHRPELSPAAGHRRRARGEPRRRPRPAVDAPRGGRRVRVRARARPPRGPHVGQQRTDRGRGDGQRRRTHSRLPDQPRSPVRRRALPGPPGHGSWVDPAASTCTARETGSLRVGGLVAPFSRGTIESDRRAGPGCHSRSSSRARETASGRVATSSLR